MQLLCCPIIITLLYFIVSAPYRQRPERGQRRASKRSEGYFHTVSARQHDAVVIDTRYRD
jgi:hypothetical protein